MKSLYPLKAVIPDELFTLDVTIQAQKETQDVSGQRVEEYTDVFSSKCMFTTGVRGAVRDQGLRKDDREHVRIRGQILINAKKTVEHGSRAKIVYPSNLGGATEYWRVVGVEYRPMGDYTRCAIEQFDGTVRA